jgi:hypothetical protein
MKQNTVDISSLLGKKVKIQKKVLLACSYIRTGMFAREACCKTHANYPKKRHNPSP